MNPYFLISAAIVVLSLIISFDLSPLLPTINDPRKAKDFLAIIFSLAIFGTVFIKPLRRIRFYPLLCALLSYSILRCFLGPTFRFPLLNFQEDNIWQYKVVMYQFIFFALFTAVSNLSWGAPRLKQLFSVISWTGIITAVYVLIQAAGLDQWLILRDLTEVRNTPSAALTGTMTNVTLSAAFLVIILPFAICVRHWFGVGLIILAILLCKSDMAYGALVIGILWYGLFKIKWFKFATLWAIGIFIVLLPLIPKDKMQINDSGRFGIWRQIWEDVKKSPLENGRNCFLTGYGLGTYKYIFTSLHTTKLVDEHTIERRFEQAHNEPLEWFYNTGFIGITLLIIIIFYLIRGVIPYTLSDENYLAVLTAFISALVLSCGSFIFQIEPHRFIVVMLAALIYNRITKEEKYQ